MDNKLVANETYLSRINEDDARYIFATYYTVGILLEPIKKDAKKYMTERKILGDRLVANSTLVNKHIHNVAVSRYMKNDITYKYMVSQVLESNAKKYLDLCESVASNIEWDKLTEKQSDDFLDEIKNIDGESIDLWLLIILLKAEGIVKESDYAYALLRGSVKWLTTELALQAEKEKELDEQKKRLEKEFDKEIKTQLKDLEKKLKDAEGEIKKIGTKEAGWEKKLAKKDDEYNNAVTQIKEQKETIGALKKDNTKMFQIIENMEKECAGLKAKLKKEEKEHEEDTSRLNGVIIELKQDLKNACDMRGVEKTEPIASTEKIRKAEEPDNYGVYIDNPITIEDILKNEEYLERRGRAILGQNSEEGVL